MSLRRTLALLLGIAVFAPWVHAAPKDKDDEEEEEETGDDEDGDKASSGDDSGGDDEGEDGGEEEEQEEEEDEKPKKKAKAEPFVKQNLSGHDQGTTKKENVFEKDRFFADKTDTDKTEKGTLIQGSLASSSFAMTESGGTYGGVLGDNSARFSRVFTELRLQTDFRHIAASRWDARIDARVRVVNTPDESVSGNDMVDATISEDPNRVQSGFNGTNEYDIRELWLFRSGKRSDIFFGRQFVPDLGGIKFDGLRLDYASSRKLTFIAFGGLYPLRGSRSITTDYQPLKTNQYGPAGRLVGAGGFGGAYRTVNSYGAIGGVALVPPVGSDEPPRIFVTSTGYLRYGSTLDVYHFALVDLYSQQGAGLTNLSAGLNWKPAQRLRVTAAVNRVDVDTLAVQANAFLNQADVSTPEGQGAVQNESYFRRLATNTARVGVSAGLGEQQRFELSTQLAYRYRPSVAIPVGDQLMPMSSTVKLQGNRGVELLVSIVDRRSIADLRLGAEVSRTIGIGGDNAIAFNRSNVLSFRAFGSRELANGHGEWEIEASYATTKDSASGVLCENGIQSCYGSSTGSIASLGGHLFYRINRDWFAIGSGFLSRQQLTHNYTGAPLRDPAIYGVLGFFRIAYRF